MKLASMLSLLSFALFSSPLPSLAQECVEPPPDMVGWWPGDGNFDDIESGNDGAADVTVGFVDPGKVDEAFSFSGDPVRVTAATAPDIGLLEPTDALTVDAWVRSHTALDSSDFPNKDTYIVAKGASGVCTGASYGLRIKNRGELEFFVNRGDEGTTEAKQDRRKLSVSAMWDAEWHHVTGTFEFQDIVKPNGQPQPRAFIKLYVDGELVGERDEPDTEKVISYGEATLRDLTIGSHPDPGNGCFPFSFGDVDEVEIFERALVGPEDEEDVDCADLAEITEIESIFCAGSAGKCKGLATTLEIRSETICSGDVQGVPTTATATTILPITIVGLIDNQDRFAGDVTGGALQVSTTPSPPGFVGVLGAAGGEFAADLVDASNCGGAGDICIDLSSCDAATCFITLVSPDPAQPFLATMVIDGSAASGPIPAEVVEDAAGTPVLISFDFTPDQVPISLVIPTEPPSVLACESTGSGSACLGDAACGALEITFDGTTTCTDAVGDCEVMEGVSLTGIADINGLNVRGVFVVSDGTALYVAEPIGDVTFEVVTSDGMVTTKPASDVAGQVRADVELDFGEEGNCSLTSATTASCDLGDSVVDVDLTGTLDMLGSWALTSDPASPGSLDGTVEIDLATDPPSVIGVEDLGLVDLGLLLDFTDPLACGLTCTSNATGETCVGDQFCFNVAVDIDAGPLTCGTEPEVMATLWAAGEALNKATFVPETGVITGFSADFELEFGSGFIELSGTQLDIDTDPCTSVQTDSCSGISGNWEVPVVVPDQSSPCDVTIADLLVTAPDAPPVVTIEKTVDTVTSECFATVSGGFLPGSIFPGAAADLTFEVDGLKGTLPDGQVCTIDDVIVTSRLTRALLEKTKTSGPSFLSSECPDFPAVFEFVISYNGAPAVITDTIPAEWEACTGPDGPLSPMECEAFVCDNTVVPGSDECKDLVGPLGCTASEGTLEIVTSNPGSSAAEIEWTLAAGAGDATVTCTVGSRTKPQNQNCEYNPSSCGVFEINRGATAVFLDGSVPVPGKPAAGLGPTDPIELQVCPTP